VLGHARQRRFQVQSGLLTPEDIRRLCRLARVEITAGEIEQALAAASPEPLALSDPSLWQDWLTFLEGAAVRGGMLVRP